MMLEENKEDLLLVGNIKNNKLYEVYENGMA